MRKLFSNYFFNVFLFITVIQSLVTVSAFKDEDYTALLYIGPSWLLSGLALLYMNNEYALSKKYAELADAHYNYIKEVDSWIKEWRTHGEVCRLIIKTQGSYLTKEEKAELRQKLKPVLSNWGANLSEFENDESERS